MRLLPLVFLLLSAFSCKDDKSASNGLLQKELISAFKYHEVNNNLVNTDELKLAPGAWGAALRVSVYGSDFERGDYCLFIKKPRGLEPGSLRFIQANEFEKSCADHLFTQKIIGQIEFYNIYLELKDHLFSIKVDDKVFEYPLFNSHNEWGVGVSPERPDTRAYRVKLKDGALCQEVKDDCSTTADLCSQCANGSYYFKTSSCSQKISRVCGRDNCGLRGSPACIRGEVSTGVRTYCIQDSPVGFCIGNARVACVDGKLICE